MKKFDFAIGNPPYQQLQESNDTDNSKKNYAPPIYDQFIDASYEVANRVELIHPARFLFNAGSTSKAWNEKMLNDPHLKVLMYESDSNKIFPGLSSPIKGGLAVTYRDNNQFFGPIQVFGQYSDANSITHKVINDPSFVPLSEIIYSRTIYRLTESFHKDYPDARYREDEEGNSTGLLSKGHDYDMASNIFERIPMAFHDTKPNDKHQYIKIIGRIDNQRVYKFIRRDYVSEVDNLDYFKVLLPQATGTGIFGETFSNPFVEGPGVGNTETFISFGKYLSKDDAEANAKYLKTKFARLLLGMLKVTQNGNKPVWRLIPLQDFSSKSDINWNTSIHEIDLQLYKKYNLTTDEIDFIETHIQEMK